MNYITQDPARAVFDNNLDLGDGTVQVVETRGNGVCRLSRVYCGTVEEGSVSEDTAQENESKSHS